jgi:hypothetical protein
VSTEDSTKSPRHDLKPFYTIFCVHRRILKIPRNGLKPFFVEFSVSTEDSTKSPRHGLKPFYTIFCVHRRILKIPRNGLKPFFVESSVSTEYTTLEWKIKVIVSCYVYDKRFIVGDQNDIFKEHGYARPPHSRK